MGGFHALETPALTEQDMKDDDRLDASAAGIVIGPWTRSPIVTRFNAAFLLLSLGIQSQGLAVSGTTSPDASSLVGKIRPAVVVLVSLGRQEKAKSFGSGF